MAPGTLLVAMAALGTALSSCGLDLETPRLFRGDPGGAFGASVAQLGTGDDGWLLVGAPLERGGSDTAPFTAAGFRSGTCRKLPLQGPPGAVNSSLGLALAAGEDAALVCGPTSPQVCGVNVHLNGFCVQLDSALRPVRNLPEKFPECPKPSLDIAFLVDGSGSIGRGDFETMKIFIAAVIRRFRHADVQFSLTQFSDKIRTHFDFGTFRNLPDPARLLRNVRQLGGSTYTATAILTVLQEMFVADRGARAGARRILVVVTDGQKFGDSRDYPEVISKAEAMAVTRYAIGVGRAFQSPSAHQELLDVASSPAHVFRVDSFGALEGIQSELQEKIFAIEGTSSALSSSFQLEMAQEGFSATLTPAGPALGAVGAFDWSGGVLVYGGGGAATFINGSGPHLGTPGGHLGTPGAHLGTPGGHLGTPGGHLGTPGGHLGTPGAHLGTPGAHLGTPGGHLGTPGGHLDGVGDMRDAYLGYSAVAVPWGHSWALVLGAPRWGHLGRVIVLSGHTWTLQAQATGRQVGSYFGASLLALEPRPGEPSPGEPRPGEPSPGELSPGEPSPGEPSPGEPRPGEPLRILVGAPLFYGGGSGGRVELCELQGSHLRCHLSLRGSPGQPLGRFGASLAHLGDLDGDTWPEVAVGAPLEDDGGGAVYLFRGAPGGVSAEGAQRIPGSRFPSQPRFFGQSLSGGRDLSGDHLPDLAVGARGQVLLLRSPPLLQVRLSLTFEPQVIPAAVSECPEEGEEPRAHLARARPLLHLRQRSRDSFGSELSLSLHFRAELDPGRLRSRGIFASGTFQNGSLRMGEGRSCRSLEIFSKGCPQDTLTPLTLRVTLSGVGDPLEAAGGLRPQLGPDSDTAVTASLPFEHDCGPDNSCQDELHVGLRLEGPGVLVVGDGDALGVTVTVTNRGESSFGPAVTLGHPEGLSYRKVEVIEAPRRSVTVRCHSEAPEGRGHLTLCQVQPPLLRAGAQVIFRVTLDVPPQVELGDSLEVTAEATSSNPGAPGSGGRSQRATIPVRYQVFLVLASSPDSTRYLNVTSGSAPPPPRPPHPPLPGEGVGGAGPGC
ncbi:integrin alpha-M [Poecile atricapillus]|uniref:integrin alpha-M n=1 Tax=Poecile atricapillus TaxID=48891 RepID=UPI00273875EB|nr:integrin alpha-M [Poecile atricapillus]